MLPHQALQLPGQLRPIEQPQLPGIFFFSQAVSGTQEVAHDHINRATEIAMFKHCRQAAIHVPQRGHSSNTLAEKAAGQQQRGGWRARLSGMTKRRSPLRTRPASDLPIAQHVSLFPPPLPKKDKHRKRAAAAEGVGVRACWA